MKILFLCENFPPERNAPASRTYEHAQVWVAQGHEVTVITSAPNFPEGKVFEGYKNAWRGVSLIDGIRVIRVKTLIASNSGRVLRSLDYISYMMMSFVMGLFEKKPDLVIGTSPQILTAVSAFFLACVKRRPFIMEVRDLWPDSIIAVGALQKGLIYRFLKKVEQFLYMRASSIIAVSKSIQGEIVRVCRKEEKVRLIYNGANLQMFHSLSKDETTLKELGIEDRSVIGYMGTIGMAHGLDKIVRQVNSMNIPPNPIFLIIGGGAGKPALASAAKEIGVEKVKILPFQDRSKMPIYWSMCDMALISLRDLEIFKTVIPSKIFEAAAMEVPMLYIGPEGEAAKLIRSYRCGLVIKSLDDPTDLEKLTSLLSDEIKLKEMKENCKKVAGVFNREKQALKFLEVLKNVN